MDAAAGLDTVHVLLGSHRRKAQHEQMPVLASQHCALKVYAEARTHVIQSVERVAGDMTVTQHDMHKRFRYHANDNLLAHVCVQ